ncbi:MAG: TetR/AcrR family transcriptional regulator [Iamia sp.]
MSPTTRNAPSPRSSEPLSAEAWARAALDVIAGGGVDAIAVERMARQLGVTKGSFYWHYADRSALVAAALGLWERRGTLDVIARLRELADPTERLRALFSECFGDDPDGAVDGALLARIEDPVVGPVVRRVTQRRLAFVEELYQDLGLGPVRAARQARIAYSAYVGHTQVRRSLPDDEVLADPSSAYLRQVLEALAPPG